MKWGSACSAPPSSPLPFLSGSSPGVPAQQLLSGLMPSVALCCPAPALSSAGGLGAGAPARRALLRSRHFLPRASEACAGTDIHTCARIFRAQVMEEVTKGIVNKLLHGPMAALRCDGADPAALQGMLQASGGEGASHRWNISERGGPLGARRPTALQYGPGPTGRGPRTHGHLLPSKGVSEVAQALSCTVHFALALGSCSRRLPRESATPRDPPRWQAGRQAGQGPGGRLPSLPPGICTLPHSAGLILDSATPFAAPCRTWVCCSACLSSSTSSRTTDKRKPSYASGQLAPPGCTLACGAAPARLCPRCGSENQTCGRLQNFILDSLYFLGA